MCVYIYVYILFIFFIIIIIFNTISYVPALSNTLISIFLQKCDIYLADMKGRSCMHLACIRNHTNIVQWLMQQGVGLVTADHKGRTPAHCAAKHGSLACLKELDGNDMDLTMSKNLYLIIYTIEYE